MVDLANTLDADPWFTMPHKADDGDFRAFATLEDEMCSAIGEGSKSPDRLDALVWAVSDLMLRRRAEPRVRIL